MRRRKSREAAMQILYSIDGTKIPESIDDGFVGHLLNFFYGSFMQRSATDESFLFVLIKGTLEHYSEFNHLIAKQSEHWKLERMAVVDRNILRLALFELTSLNDVPSSVSINEAVEIAKRYGTDESGAFINGILDQIWKSLPKNPDKVRQ